MATCTGKCPICEKMAYVVDKKAEIDEKVATCNSSLTYICYRSMFNKAIRYVRRKKSCEIEEFKVGELV